MKSLPRKPAISLIILFGLIGTVLLIRSFAGTGPIGVDVKSSQLSVSAEDAFDGNYIAFNTQDTGEYTFEPSSLEDWEFAPQNTYTATNETRYVSPTGSNSGNGTNRSSPISLTRATSIVEPGDVVYLLPGTYSQQFNLEDKDGTESQPIVFTSEPGSARSAVISHGSSHIGRVLRSDNVVIDSLVFDGKNSSVWGFATNRRYADDPTNKGGSKNLSLIGNEIKNVGKENALNISLVDTSLVFNNYIHDAGPPKDHRGEGIYIGCGACDSKLNTSKNIVITHNKIQNVGSEGIEVKAGTRDVVVSDNLILDSGWNQTYSEGKTCCFGGAIVITPMGSKPDYDTKAIIERNRTGRLSYSGLVIGRGDTVVRNNLVWDSGVKHRDGYGSAASTIAREPYVTNNLFFGVYDSVSFEDNYAFSLNGKNVFTDINTYGRPAQQKANVVKKEFSVEPNADAAFAAWREASF